ncbi:unnamed protein product [Ceutorhynchus assimilis]|uniref:Uncharacterized protein n=1 Tax=Ceutorhynchus assimilis TaxID=467358 RepID=A0A9N9QI19_9CUCU|nr:unnamed protein product [Ceutorhynchus assimilis]
MEGKDLKTHHTDRVSEDQKQANEGEPASEAPQQNEPPQDVEPQQKAPKVNCQTSDGPQRRDDEKLSQEQELAEKLALLKTIPARCSRNRSNLTIRPSSAVSKFGDDDETPPADTESWSSD